MKRRAWVLAAGAVLALPKVLAQPAKLPRRVALLTTSTEANYETSLRAFRDGLRERGHVEGRDIAIDVRYAGGRAPELSRLAAELAALGPAVIVAPGGDATDAALAAAPGVPVVSLGDLVAAGHAAQLGRPGGRVTGISFLAIPLNAKRLELLAQLLPKGAAVLNLADSRPVAGSMQAVEDAGRSLGLATHAAYARTLAEIETAFVTARSLRVAGVNVLNSPFLYNHRARIIELAAAARLPAIFQWPDAAHDGALMGYGPNRDAMFRQLAGYASRILNGDKPSDLPVEQPTRFELAINLKTAKALGITIPPSLLLRADEVIE